MYFKGMLQYVWKFDSSEKLGQLRQEIQMAVCSAGQKWTIYVEKSVGVRKCIFFCLIDSPHSRFRVQMPSNSEETQIIGHRWQVCPVAVLDLLFNHEHLVRSLEQHMAMNCLKYFISEVLFVFNDFCLAQTSTYKN